MLWDLHVLILCWGCGAALEPASCTKGQPRVPHLFYQNIEL